ncbi:3-hydroxyacyl-CoA dehydrogenase [Agromyces mediolanus]|uniref:3-hydroxyacyl-CoA dehydrogenase n=1 Tax=Agromyces mediolanus TaxID=41986 RepID=UPI00203C8CA2|nr:3-hydroxyacyl-CoA dehydrogenase [Agromyces mediolanus]MCM3657836.1 3-hydroxyacyl-CoA dehydrogenase [Agromyces mediolanus]
MSATGEAERVAVVGSGSIGVAFAIVFARAGFRVALHDPVPAARERAEAELAERLELLAEAGLLPGGVGAAAARISLHATLDEAVAGCALVQECAPEQRELKRELFALAAAAAPAGAVLASSSSAIPPSELADGLPEDAAGRLVVGHPGNPPYLLPVLELVPSPRTDPAVLARARDVYERAGLRVVELRREVEGFVFNRLQGALLREAYCLVRDGVVDVDGVDEIVRSGLGRRWSVVGPFETSDLNVRGGIAAHAERMGGAYARMGAERGQHDPWSPELVDTVAAQRRAILPLERWDERVRWRDRRLTALTAVWDDGARNGGEA